MRTSIPGDIISSLFIILFLYAAVNKGMDHNKFVLQLGQSPLLTAMAKPMSWLVPSLEILIASLLISSRLRLAGLYAAYTLMVMFTAYIVAITRFSGYIPCACGGILQKMGWGQHLVFNVVFVFLALLGVLLEPRRERAQSKSFSIHHQ